jgi:hypothetical protein
MDTSMDGDAHKPGILTYHPVFQLHKSNFIRLVWFPPILRSSLVHMLEREISSCSLCNIIGVIQRQESVYICNSHASVVSAPEITGFVLAGF